ncbi:CGP-CTERM-anchored Cys-rich protein [Thermococcus sp. M36]|uniref:CGP-CTERM-anchored Cys-rich protein n=1 Tax=Thermococcus sp. M36 TaxID=1638261 RepID=UPI003183E19C
MITPCVYREWYPCLELTTCGCVNGVCTWKPNPEFESCLKEHGVDLEEVIRAGSFKISVEAVNKSDGEVNSAIRDFLGAFRISCNSPLTLVKPSRRELSSSVAPSEINASEVLKAELEWLREFGVINIGAEDVAAIAGVARWGYAGPNSRIGWYETKDGTHAWIPYHESPSLPLVRCSTGEVPRYDLPNGTAYIGPTPIGPPSADATTTEGSPNGEICGPALLAGLSLVSLLGKR